MTKDEAEKIAAIIATADHGCSACADDLAMKMTEAFPKFEWRWVHDEGTVVVRPAGGWAEDDKAAERQKAIEREQRRALQEANERRMTGRLLP